MLPEIYFQMNFIFSIILCRIGLIFSVLTVIVIVENRRFETFHYLFICNSSFASILYCMITMIGSSYSLQSNWMSNEPYCSFRAYLYNVSIACICHSKSVHAISRFFFSILYKYRFLLTKRIHQVLIVLTWLISLIVCIPPFFVENGYGLEIESRSCVISSQKSFIALYITFVSCLIPFNIVIFIYLYILFNVYRSTRRVNAFDQTDQRLRKNRREIRLMKEMIIQTIILLSGGPIFLFLLTWNATQTSQPAEYLYLLGFNLMTLVATIVPLIQFLFNRQLTNSLRFIFQRYQRHLWIVH